MDFVNIGILAHVDAGKTSLTERLLFNAGVIDRIGSVDKGNTQTDSLELERRRGITIQSAVVAFHVGDLQVNVIDTPGHSDFVSEVERALRVLDGAILVISAVEGVQARTRVLMRSLVRLRIPTLIFVNKIDRMGARYSSLLDSISDSLSPDCVALERVADIGTAEARVFPFSIAEPPFRERLAETLGNHSDALLEAYLEDAPLSESDYFDELVRQTRNADVYPVFFGSAITGEGVGRLVDGIATLFARSGGTGAPGDHADGQQLRATVMKIERGRAGEKIAYVRVREGVIRPRDKVSFYRREPGGGVRELSGRVSAVQVFEHGTSTREAAATPGTIAKLWGLPEVQVGDQLGTAGGLPTQGVFAPPTLETVVTPASPQQRPVLYTALQRIAEQDPLIDVRRDETTSEISVRLYGEVQKEVIATTLLETFGLEVSFADSRTIYFERPVGVGEAQEEISMDAVNFFWATVGLRVEPTTPGTGIVFRLAVELGGLPLAFHKAIEESVYKTLQQGVYGWEVLDCAVTVTRTGYASPVSAAGDFRSATPLVVAAALKRAGTQVYEPVHRFELETPTDCTSQVLVALAAVGGIAEDHSVLGRTTVLRGTIPASNVHLITQRLAELTHGEGVMISGFEGYRPFAGHPVPTREHTGANPYDREQYILHALGRVAHEPEKNRNSGHSPVSG